MGRLRLHLKSPAENLHDLAFKEKKEHEATKAEEYGPAERPHYPIVSRRTSDADLTFISPSEIERHDGCDGRRLFVVVDCLVLDCSEYINKHPGGATIIRGFGGQDCSWQWWAFHNRKVWNDVLLNLRVGRTEGVKNLHERPGRAFVGLRGFGYQQGYS